MIDLTYGSVCSGIESASVAWEPIGMRPLWLSEIEPFPCAVLKHHWPQVPNLGDMTQLAAWIRAGAVPAPLILVGGTPCQDFSVAGKGESLDGDRGQLTITYGDIANAIDEQRDDGDECVIVWENVPGVLSTKDNAFGYLLGLLAGEFTPSDIDRGGGLGLSKHNPVKVVKSGQSLVVLLDPKGPSHGGLSMPNISEWPNAAAVCSLSQVLETGSIPQKYYLSSKACAGILRRAEKRKKDLPPTLRTALELSIRNAGSIKPPTNQ